MEDAVAWIIALGVIFVRVVLPVIRWFQEQQEKQSIGGEAQDQIRVLREMLEAAATGRAIPGGREQFEAAQRRLEALKKQAQLQIDKMPTGEGPLAVIRETLQEPTLTDLDRAERKVQAALELLGGADEAATSAFLRNDSTLQDAKYAADQGEARIGTLVEAAILRRGRMAEVMGDADAFAAALVEPLRAFARGHGLPLPPNAPICIPTEPGTEAVARGLFAEHPVIFVPQDFGEHIFRWPAVAHEIGHVIWHSEPTLRRAMGNIMPSNERPWLPRAMNGRLIFNIDAAFNGWLEEIVCDAFSVLLLGPAGFRGLCHAFTDSDQHMVTLASWDPSGQLLGEHPPRLLRVHMAAWLLHHLGYDVEAKPILEKYLKDHDNPDYLLLRVQNSDQTVAVDLQGFVDKGTYILGEMMHEEFRGLNGYPFSAVVGQELSPGVWARVKRRADDLLNEVPFHDTPRVAIAAGIEAAAKSPAARNKIAAGVRSTIVGRGQRASKDRNFRGHVHGEGDPRPPRKVARDAIILWELLNRRHARRGPKAPTPPAPTPPGPPIPQ